MIAHRPADDPPAVQVHDGGQIEPSLAGLDIGDIGEPDPVQRGGGEVAIEQIGRDRQVVLTVGGPDPSRPCHDGANTVAAHQALDASTTCAPTLSLQFAMDTWAAVAFVTVAVDLLDVDQQGTVGDRSRAVRARAPGVITGP